MQRRSIFAPSELDFDFTLISYALFADEVENSIQKLGAKNKNEYYQLPLRGLKTERCLILQPQTPRHNKRYRKDNAFAWNSSELASGTPQPAADLCGFRSLASPKRRLSDPTGHFHLDASKRMRIDDESYLSPLPPICAPTPKVQLPLLQQVKLQLANSFNSTHTRTMSEDLSNSQVELSRLSFF